jgi:peptidoglycan LD-endopeptidase LytH
LSVRHVLAAALVLACLVGLASPVRADQLSEAKARQRALQQELDAATAELVGIDTQRYLAAQNLTAARNRLGRSRAELDAARRTLAEDLASLYKSGGASPLSSLLASDVNMLDRVEFETIMLDSRANALANARTAADSYERAIREVNAALARSEELQKRAKTTATKLAGGFEKAKQVTDKLAGFNKTVLVGGRFVSCPVSPPYSFIDSFGFPRSGGRRHKGTDIMNPWGNKVHAVVDGVISRQTSSALGGISLYLMGNDGTEFYYAHLSRYASRTGQRVKAGELIAYNGDTGNAAYTAPHVHFEMHPGGTSVINPYPFVKAACG